MQKQQSIWVFKWVPSLSCSVACMCLCFYSFMHQQTLSSSFKKLSPCSTVHCMWGTWYRFSKVTHPRSVMICAYSFCTLLDFFGLFIFNVHFFQFTSFHCLTPASLIVCPSLSLLFTVVTLSFFGQAVSFPQSSLVCRFSSSDVVPEFS